jgi:hypothetical protein
VTPTYCCCDVTAHPQADGHAGNTCHVTVTYCWCVTSPILCQLPDTWKTQLALLLWACIVFRELLPGKALIKYATILCICSTDKFWNYIVTPKSVLEIDFNDSMRWRQFSQQSEWLYFGWPGSNTWQGQIFLSYLVASYLTGRRASFLRDRTARV